MKILITGASSGLGAEFARQYASKDNELILLARREAKLQQLQKEISPHCKSVKIIVVDVTDFALLQEKIESIGSVDMLILNAGVSLGHSEDIPTIAAFKNLYDVNVLSNHAILEVLMPKLREHGSGKVVFISSLASLFSMPSSKVYSSSKRALNAYAEGLRYKYSSYGIKIITLLPGFIKSELTDKNDFSMPFLLETSEGVLRMKNAIDKGKEFYAFPLRFYLIIRFMNLLPSALSQRIVNYLSN
ncbi:SDR family NAD(P)-dependent oxidoreductase [Sulfurimonas paralvinellae]|uniref:SDR family NAD(P)-dependent oxidoreductase n=1 Tax=Sulfurimonas paralvinellae TaxID=317658 RepID=A0A7M1B9X5_9BACT|nr:SDR family NAD(P)-dependent oxidoreductase [Sulfurimonas paralvinellae]QOP46431.1 SDR family NAD(P)-dependent oxidoreductase [Sulfurimonas paralvinellae]